MSIQPSPNSKQHANQEKWHRLINLADNLSTQFSLKSLLLYVKSILEQGYDCKVRIWLDPILFSALIAQGDIHKESALTDKKTRLMEQVYLEKQIFPNILSIPNAENPSNVQVFPLIAMDQVLGVMQLDMIKPANVNLYDLDYKIGFTSQFSLALYHLLYDTHSGYIQKTFDYLEMCEDISKSVLSNLERSSLFTNVLSLLFRKLNCVRVYLYTVRGDNQKVLKRIGISSEGLEPERIFDYREIAGMLAQSLSRLEPEVVNNKVLSLNISTANNTQSVLIFPLLCSEILVGAIELQSDTSDAFGPETLRGLQALTQNIALAIRNANLYQSVQSRCDYTERLQKDFGVLSPKVSLDDLLKIVLDALEEFFDWEAATIWLFERAGRDAGLDQFTSPIRLAGFRIKNQAFPVSEHNIPQNTTELFDKYINSTISEDDLFSLYPWISELLNSKVSEIRNSPFQYEPLGAILGFNSDYSAIGAPLHVHDQPIGAIVFAHQLPDQYDEETLSLVSTFATQASIAIENNRLYAAAHDQAWISTVLLQVSDATQWITNLDDLLETIVSILPGLIGVDACSIFLFDPTIEAFIHRGSYGFEEQVKDSL